MTEPDQKSESEIGQEQDHKAGISGYHTYDTGTMIFT